jgi:sugar phosphate isomerase/epimerase
VSFRVGATSFTVPATWSENVRQLAGRVEDVELLFFDSRELPSPGEIEAIAEVRGELTFTLHTPLDVSLASEDAERRHRGVERVLAAIDRAAPLRPHSSVVHVYLGDGEHGPRPVDLEAWRSRAAESLLELLSRGVRAETLCVEVLDYDFELLAPVVSRLGLSIALDAGHVHRDGGDPVALLERHRDRVRVVQWHGTEPGGRDHRSLVHLPRAAAQTFVDALVRFGFEGVLTLDVFRERDLEESLELLRELRGGRAR